MRTSLRLAMMGSLNERVDPHSDVLALAGRPGLWGAEGCDGGEECGQRVDDGLVQW
ncbi:hypothetical protein [Streptomyces sp. NPDC094466]|uniref:hypothetical protein n=1 Tax=Streptomyces sp. NPDC094466 TaxID=3366065 RepID=UPI0037FFFC63